MALTVSPTGGEPRETKRAVQVFQREPAFYQDAWVELGPFFDHIADQLVRDYAFVLNDTGINEPYSISLASTINSEQIIRLPREFNQAQVEKLATLSRDPVSHTPLSLDAVAPLVDLVCILQCLLPPRIGDDHSVPSRSWLKKHEAMIRDVMGDSHFRHLLEAASKVN